MYWFLVFLTSTQLDMHHTTLTNAVIKTSIVHCLEKLLHIYLSDCKHQMSLNIAFQLLQIICATVHSYKTSE